MKRLIFAVLVIFAAPVHADLNESMQQMCGKIKTCSLAEVKRQGLPEEMATMMTTMIDGMCLAWMSPYAKTLGDAGLEDKAVACIDSVVEESCDDLMARQGEFTTPQCEAFKVAAEEADVELE